MTIDGYHFLLLTKLKGTGGSKSQNMLLWCSCTEHSLLPWKHQLKFSKRYNSCLKYYYSALEVETDFIVIQYNSLSSNFPLKSCFSYISQCRLQILTSSKCVHLKHGNILPLNIWVCSTISRHYMEPCLWIASDSVY